MDLGVTIHLCIPVNAGVESVMGTAHVPEVLVIRNLAFVRFASPNMFRVPRNEVFTVFTALNW